MLELRFRPDQKRVAAMRAAVARACRRSASDAEHADAVAAFVATLVTEQASSKRQAVLLVVNEHSDVTTIMIRLSAPADRALTDASRTALEMRAARWSTMAGRDGRTIVAEIPRPQVAVEHVPRRLDAPVVAAR